MSIDQTAAVRRRRWRNWAGNQVARPTRIARPRTLDELVEVVTSSAAVKAAGSGHSFSAVAVAEDVQVRLDRLAGLGAVDEETGLVTVAAGTTLRDLNARLAFFGRGLTNMGDVDAQTVAGALATGTHGSGRDSASLAAQVAALELVLADGTVVTCSRGQRPDLFDAARVGLGALGIVTSVTLRTEAAFLLRADERPLPFDEVLDGFDELVATNEHVDAYWFPHTDTVVVKCNNRVGGAPLRRRVRRFVEDELLANGVFGLTCRLGRAVPSSIPAVNRAVARAFTPRTYVDVAPEVFTSPRRVRFEEMEYAIPRAALPAVLRELRAFVQRRDLRISFPVELRVAPPDDAWLSPARGRETAYVAVHVFRGSERARYFDGAERIFLDAGGRPHWGKLHSLGADELRRRHPRFDDFLRVRDEVDPGRRFANAHLERILGP